MKPRIAIGMQEFAELPKWVDCRITNIDKTTIHKGISEFDFPADYWEYFDKKKEGLRIIPTSYPFVLESISDTWGLILMNPLTQEYYLFSWQNSTTMKVCIGARVLVLEGYTLYLNPTLLNLFYPITKTQSDKSLHNREDSNGFGCRSVISKKESNLRTDSKLTKKENCLLKQDITPSKE